jgi:predicted PurR-regulated permease PerM
MIDSRPETRAPLIPTWLSNAAAIGWRVLVVFALIVVLADLAVILGTVVASILFALIVAVLFAPVATRLRGRGWSRTKTAGAVTLLAIIAIGLIVVLLAVAVVPLVPGIVEAIQSGLTGLQADANASGQGGQLADALGQARSNAEAWLGSQLVSVASWLATAVTVTILGSILTFFLLQDGDKAWAWALQATGDRRREVILSSGDAALSGVGVWLRGTATQAAIDAVTVFVFLSVLGIPAALALSIIAFFASFIPYLGGLLVMTVLLVVTYASGGLAAAGAIFVAVILVHVLQTSVVAPRVFRGAVRMPRPAVLIALPIGAAMAGFVGLFLAVPAVAFGYAVAGSLIDVIGMDVTGAPGESTSIVPRWLDRLAQWSWRSLIGLAFLGVAVLLAVQVPIVLIPVTLAIILAATLLPIYRRLRARGWSPTSAAGTVTVASIVITTVVVVLTVVSLATQMGPIVKAASDGAGQAVASNPQVLAWLQPLVSSSSDFLAQAGQAVVSGSVGLAVVCVIGVLLTFDFMRDGPRFWSFATSRLAAWRRTEVDAAGGRAVGVLGGYMIGTGAISLFGAVTQLLIMTILGIPLALPLAVLSFFGGFIPYIGSILTTGLAFLVTLALGTPQDAAIMGVYTIVFNVVQGNFVAPIVYGRAVNIHPAIVLLAIPAGAALAGIAGMFLVVPFIGVIATTWRTGLLVLGDGPAVVAVDGDDPEPG